MDSPLMKAEHSCYYDDDTDRHTLPTHYRVVRITRIVAMTQNESPVFGNLLRRHRIFASMSQEELAARAGLSARAISDLERGVKRIPRRDTVQLLIEALALSGDERTAFVAAAREPALRPGGTPSASVQMSALDSSPSSQPQATIPTSVPGVSTRPAAITPPIGGYLGAAPQGLL